MNIKTFNIIFTFILCFLTYSSKISLAQPANDNPCNAIALTIGSSCTFTQYTNAGATASAGVPAPGCASYSGGDVWFTITVPAAGGLLTFDSNTGAMTDGGMALYSGTCGSLTLIQCDDDASANGLMPMISRGCLTPGSTIWIRFWEFGNNNNGTFSICVYSTASAVPTVQDCPAAIPICQVTYSETNAYSGTGNILNEIDPNPSCLGSGEKNDVWYIFTVQSSGNLNFSITPNVLTDDYDWAVYNLTNANCSDISCNGSLEVGCNYSATSGITGPNGLAGTQNGPVIPVTIGQTYVINVSQFSTSTNGYTIDFSASSAVVLDNVLPFFASIDTPITCGTTSLTFNFSENVQCNTVQATDFTLTGPGGPYSTNSVFGAACSTGAPYENRYTITLSNPITLNGSYSLNLVGPVTDNCNNVVPTASLPFTINNCTAVKCTSTTIIAVNVIQCCTTLAVVTAFTKPSCNGSSNGTATATASGGLAPYTYVWNTGVTAQTFTGLAAGTYTVTAKDANNCKTNVAVTVTQPAVLTASFTKGTSACAVCMCKQWALFAVLGGTLPYTYNWTNGYTDVYQNKLCPGSFSASATDANGCKVNLSTVLP